jgi:hypothetical protein
MANGTLKVSNIQTSSGSGTITLGQSGETVTIASGATQTGIGENMTPAFFARLSSDQSISNETNTIVQFNSEVYDTDSAYDNSSNYRFTIPSGKAGKYFIYSMAQLAFSNADRFLLLKIYKNGSEFGKFTNTYSGAGTDVSCSVHLVDDASVGDYYDMRVYQNDGTRTLSGHSTRNITVFGALRIIT